MVPCPSDRSPARVWATFRPDPLPRPSTGVTRPPKTAHRGLESCPRPPTEAPDPLPRPSTGVTRQPFAPIPLRSGPFFVVIPFQDRPQGSQDSPRPPTGAPRQPKTAHRDSESCPRPPTFDNVVTILHRQNYLTDYITTACLSTGQHNSVAGSDRFTLVSIYIYILLYV